MATPIVVQAAFTTPSRSLAYGASAILTRASFTSPSKLLAKAVSPLLVQATMPPASAYAAAVLADGPVAYWRLGETSGTTALDSSGNGHNGTYSGAPTLGATGALWSDANTAVSFDGIDDTVTIADAAALNFGTGSFSVETWMRFPPGSSNPKWSLGKGNPYAAETPGWGVVNWTEGVPVYPGLYLSDGTTFFPAYSMGTPRGAWVHVVFVVDRPLGRVVTYGNGVTVSVVPIPGGFGGVSYAGPLLLGNGNGNPFTGSLDEVAVYNTALTTPQVLNHYKAAGDLSGVLITENATPILVRALSTMPANQLAAAAGLVLVTVGLTTPTRLLSSAAAPLSVLLTVPPPAYALSHTATPVEVRASFTSPATQLNAGAAPLLVTATLPGVTMLLTATATPILVAISFTQAAAAIIELILLLARGLDDPLVRARALDVERIERRS